MTTKIKVCTLPISGKQVQVRGVANSIVAMEVLKGLPRPKPPTVRVDYGSGHFEVEQNPADPDYNSRIVPEWEADLEIKRSNLILKRGVVKRKLTSDEEMAVNDVRQDYLEEGITLSRNDWLVYVKHVLCEGDDDLIYLLKFIGNNGDPTQGEGVDEIVDGFRGDIQGA